MHTEFGIVRAAVALLCDTKLNVAVVGQIDQHTVAVGTTRSVHRAARECKAGSGGTVDRGNWLRASTVRGATLECADIGVVAALVDCLPERGSNSRQAQATLCLAGRLLGVAGSVADVVVVRHTGQSVGSAAVAAVLCAIPSSERRHRRAVVVSDTGSAERPTGVGTETRGTDSESAIALWDPGVHLEDEQSTPGCSCPRPSPREGSVHWRGTALCCTVAVDIGKRADIESVRDRKIECDVGNAARGQT